MGSYIRKIIQLESSLKASEQSFANAVHKVESQSKENTILRARLTAAETARDEAQSCCASVADRLNTMIRETGPMTEQVREYLSITSMVNCIDVLSSRYFQLKLDRDELRERVKVVEQDNERLATLQGDARMALPSNANHTKSVAENIKALVKGAEIFCEKYNAMNQERDALETEVERLRQDGERWRFVKKYGDELHFDLSAGGDMLLATSEGTDHWEGFIDNQIAAIEALAASEKEDEDE